MATRTSTWPICCLPSSLRIRAHTGDRPWPQGNGIRGVGGDGRHSNSHERREADEAAATRDRIQRASGVASRQRAIQLEEASFKMTFRVVMGKQLQQLVAEERRARIIVPSVRQFMKRLGYNSGDRTRGRPEARHSVALRPPLRYREDNCLMRTPIIAGNWKMFKTPVEAVAFVQELAPRLPVSRLPSASSARPT